MLIGGMWMVSPAAGLATTIAVALHEMPQEFGDFGVLLARGVAGQEGALAQRRQRRHRDPRRRADPRRPAATWGSSATSCRSRPAASSTSPAPTSCPRSTARARRAALIGTSLALGLGIVLVTWLPGLVGVGHSHGHAGHDHGAHGCADPDCEEDHGGTTSDPASRGSRGSGGRRRSLSRARSRRTLRGGEPVAEPDSRPDVAGGRGHPTEPARRAHERDHRRPARRAQARRGICSPGRSPSTRRWSTR